MSDEDRIRCMLANRESPDFFVHATSVVDELDEIFELQYGYSDDILPPEDPTELDPWRRLSLTDRIVSLDSRTFRASLQLPSFGSSTTGSCGSMKTEYTLFALLRDMQDCGRSFAAQSTVFKWRDIFGSPSYSALGGKIRALWEPAPEEQQIESQDHARLWPPCAMQSREDSFIQMRENLAGLLAKVIFGLSKHEL